MTKENPFKERKNLPYFFLSLGIFIIAKLLYHQSETADLTFLLRPISAYLEFSYNSLAVYSPEKGYIHPDLFINIEKSCSGFNFWMICYLTLSFLVIPYGRNHWQKALSFIGLLALSYLLALVVNIARISVSIQLSVFNDLLPYSDAIIHQALGVITNLSFLILIYLGLSWLLNLPRHAKTT
ncbi:MAG: exosortase K [Croceimicrobium sp.]|nr:exosortase K [Bacteroidota bacterium]